MATTEVTEEGCETFIGAGPNGPFTAFATRATIEGWVADGYAHDRHEGGGYSGIPHRAQDCTAPDEWEAQQASDHDAMLDAYYEDASIEDHR